MARSERKRRIHVLVFDVESRKCSLDGGPWVYFKGCTSVERFKQLVDEQKKKDQETGEKPPEPGDDTDRDGYWICRDSTLMPGTTTWHFCSTYPPYECYDFELPC